MDYTVETFYRFVPLGALTDLRAALLTLATFHGMRGTILLAPEGINATITGRTADTSSMMQAIREIPEFAGLQSKTSLAPEMPFRRMKIRLKKEIVTLGVPGVDPNVQVGQYVKPQDWNALINDPSVLVIDTRNGFEVAAGTFPGAVDPGTKSFGEFPKFVRDKLSSTKNVKIAMFCTGGIRCEKATSFLLQEGFSDVYHLEGGILKYLEDIPAEQSLWQGECFVFDERTALGHGLEIVGVPRRGDDTPDP